MSVEVVRDTDTIVRASGEIDLSNADELESALNAARDQSPEGFVVDLTEATYIDSAGIQAILRVYVKMQETGGRLALVAGNPRIQTVLSAVGLEQFPGMYVSENLDQARQTLASPRNGATAAGS